MPLKGKIAVIPGASRPIGRAIARTFAVHGATLVLPVFDWPESIAEMEEEFTAAGYSYFAPAVDLRQEEEVAALAKESKIRFGGVDYLINNIERGGMPCVHGSYDLPCNKGQWDLELTTTLKSKWLLYHYFIDSMVSRTGGAVINISSIAAITGRSGPAAVFFSDGYSAANRAIQSFTEQWAKEVAPKVRVNELMLGLIQHRHGEGTRGWENLSNEEQENVLATIPLQRTGLPEEVAALVYFLAVEAGYLTGTCIRMDGGFALGNNKVAPLPPGILS
jgi:3-oxoacyl-[acyl-carrier protein] reductase